MRQTEFCGEEQSGSATPRSQSCGSASPRPQSHCMLLIGKLRAFCHRNLGFGTTVLMHRDQLGPYAHARITATKSTILSVVTTLLKNMDLVELPTGSFV